MSAKTTIIPPKTRNTMQFELFNSADYTSSPSVDAEESEVIANLYTFLDSLIERNRSLESAIRAALEFNPDLPAPPSWYSTRQMLLKALEENI